MRKQGFSCDGMNQVPSRIELKTDRFPKEVSWEPINAAVHPKWNILANLNFASIKNVCYQFLIKYLKGNGICCDFDDVHYKVYFDDEMVAEGVNFGSLVLQTRIIMFLSDVYKWEHLDKLDEWHARYKT